MPQLPVATPGAWLAKQWETTDQGLGLTCSGGKAKIKMFLLNLRKAIIKCEALTHSILSPYFCENSK